MKKRFLPVLMALSMILPTFAAFAEEVTPKTTANQSSPAIFAETAILMDAASGEILYEKMPIRKCTLPVSQN